jgi:hypothetical protein
MSRAMQAPLPTPHSSRPQARSTSRRVSGPTQTQAERCERQCPPPVPPGPRACSSEQREPATRAERREPAMRANDASQQRHPGRASAAAPPTPSPWAAASLGVSGPTPGASQVLQAKRHEHHCPPPPSPWAMRAQRKSASLGISSLTPTRAKLHSRHPSINVHGCAATDALTSPQPPAARCHYFV